MTFRPTTLALLLAFVIGLPAAPSASAAVAVAVHGTAAPSSVTVGTAVAPAITISGGLDPTGTATIALYDDGDVSCSGTPLYSETVTVSGAGSYATAPYTPARAGSYRWRTTYSGDADNLAGEWACGLARLDVLMLAAGLTVSVHGDPVVGRPLHASVAWGAYTCPPAMRRLPGWGCLAGGAGGGRAAVAKSGTISFSLYGPDDPSCRAAPRFTSTVPADDDGAQSAPFTPDAVGGWRWAASYSGDAANLPFETACFEQTGSRAMTIAPTAPRLTVAATGGVVGEPLRAEATLADAYEPGGELTFTLHGPGDEQCAGEPVFARSVAVAGGGATSGALAAGGARVVAGPAFAPTRAGAYRWAVSYPGDGRNGAAASGCGAAVELRARAVDPQPAPPAEPVPAPGPGAPAEPPPARPAPALARFVLASRCVRPAASGRAVTLGLRLWTGRSDAPRVRVERALGTGGRDRCPPLGSPGSFDGRYRTVATLRPALASAAAAANARLRRVTVRLRLAPALYRVSVTVGGVTKRRFLRVLAPR